jgi:hypothetical protein
MMRRAGEPSPGFGLTTPGEVGQGKAAGAAPIASGGEPTKENRQEKGTREPVGSAPADAKLSKEDGEGKPWVAAGVSRATWFRQIAAQKRTVGKKGRK